MTGIRVELNDPTDYPSPKDYVEQHLAPVATELQRITNELLSPGATSSEEWSVDMVPSTGGFGAFCSLDAPLTVNAKHVTFDGREYFALPKELLRAKQVKVQFTAVVYVKLLHDTHYPVTFRLVKDTGEVIDNSEFDVSTEEPETVRRTLPFGDARGSISPELRTYYIQARCLGAGKLPVCRRLSLSFVYI